jgi:hypothetical protein
LGVRDTDTGDTGFLASSETKPNVLPAHPTLEPHFFLAASTPPAGHPKTYALGCANRGSSFRTLAFTGLLP